MVTSPVPAPVDLVRLALDRSGRFRMRARGGSMTPALRDGDVVTIEPVRPDDVTVGDVVCHVREPGRLVLHRVVGREGDGLVTRGDALDWTEVAAPGSLLGRVTAIEGRGTLARLVVRVARVVRRSWRVGDRAGDV